MPIVEAKCTSCGAALRVNSAADAAVCPYCQTPFIVEKAIHNYHVTNNITAGTVNVIGGGVADFEIRAGTLVNYNGANVDVVIPENVVAIGDKAFKGCVGLQSVMIPAGVTSVGQQAFEGCANLKKVVISSSQTQFGPYAFTKCGLEEFTIPAGWTAIPNGFFSGCSRLQQVVISEGVEDIGIKAFNNSGLTSVTIPGSVKNIGYEAFAECSRLQQVVIGEGVEDIQIRAFYRCARLSEVSFPKSLKLINESAFSQCPKLERVKLPERVEVDDFAFYGSGTDGKVQVKRDGGGGGCYVATAVYGSYDCPQVWTLRRFRDQTLARTWYGRLFISLYYAISPSVVKYCGHTTWFNRFWRAKLDRMVRRLQQNGFEDTPYSD